jgi:5-dehydro-2-deoxygluconokinase
VSAAAIDVACIGRAAVDLYGEQVGCGLEEISTFARYLGGSPANTAVGAARLGLRSAIVSRVGDEQNGRFVRDTFVREGVDVSQLGTDPRRLTALVFLAIRDRNDFPHVFYRENCADMGLRAEDIDEGFIAGCGAVLVSGTHLSQEGTRAACERAARIAKAAGKRVILDIDYRPVLWGLARHAEGAKRQGGSEAATESIAALLPSCDLVVGTEDEFLVAGGAAELLDALRAVRARTAALLVVKLGDRGCTVLDGAIPSSTGELHVHAGFPVEVFNVLGAGDAFMAGFLRGWLRNASIEKCCRYANACGAIVVSRHGCAPAMPSEAEMQRFLALGVTTPRLREDAELEHVHRATTRRRLHFPLHVLAFDHRSQLESIAKKHAQPAERIAAFKSLIATAFLRTAATAPGAGVLIDDRYAEDVIPRLQASGCWIARPVEVPGSRPVEFESGPNVALALRDWPRDHVAKCLVFFEANDPAAIRDAQLASLGALSEACVATGHEMLLEVIASNRTLDPEATAGALETIYAAGIRPDWWKLPPSTDRIAWAAIDRAIEANDPHCRGVLVLGMEASEADLARCFAEAARSPWVRGFAVGRSIFGVPAEQWFAGAWDDARTTDEIASRYRQVIALWTKATNNDKEHA